MAYDASDPTSGLWMMDPAAFETASQRAKKYGAGLVTTGSALQAALQSRIGQTADRQLEEMNARGQGVGSGMFADALSRAIAQQGTEAELQQQQALTNANQGIFGQSLGASQSNVNAFNQARGAQAQTANDQAAAAMADKAARRRDKYQLAGSVLQGIGSVAGGYLGGRK